MSTTQASSAQRDLVMVKLAYKAKQRVESMSWSVEHAGDHYTRASDPFADMAAAINKVAKAIELERQVIQAVETIEDGRMRLKAQRDLGAISLLVTYMIESLGRVRATLISGRST